MTTETISKHPNERRPFSQKIVDYEKNIHVSKKLSALKATTAIDVAVSGSVAWALQTGIPLEAALEYASDVDVVVYKRDDDLIDAIYDAGLEDVDVKSDGWEARVTHHNLQVDNQNLQISLVDYHDIAITMGFYLTKERRFKVFQPHIIQKTLRTLQALVHIHNFAAKHDKNTDITTMKFPNFLARIKETINEIGTLIESMEFEGNELITKENLKQISLDAFKQIRSQLNDEV